MLELEIIDRYHTTISRARTLDVAEHQTSMFSGMGNEQMPSSSSLPPILLPRVQLPRVPKRLGTRDQRVPKESIGEESEEREERQVQSAGLVEMSVGLHVEREVVYSRRERYRASEDVGWQRWTSNTI